MKLRYKTGRFLSDSGIAYTSAFIYY